MSYSSVGNGMAISMNMMQVRNDRRGKRAVLPDDVAKKLKSCSVLNCEDWRELSSYTTYHCFPTGDKNQDRWEIWTQLLRKARGDESWIPFRGSLVCSHHFRPEDFISEPFSKRRKLIKNAIPSIFPSFTVDLDDPSYQLPDDDTQGNGRAINSQEFIYATDPVSMLDLTGEEGFEYEYSSEADGAASPFDKMEANDDDDEIQIIEDVNSSSKTPVKIVRNRQSSSGPTIVTSVGQVQVLSTSSVLLQPQKKQLNNLPIQIPPNQLIELIGNRNRVVLKPRSSHSSSLQRQQPHLIISSTSASQVLTQQQVKSKNLVERQQETVQALDALPFSLNPDLEIEMVDPDEDLAGYRNRIIELEQQNRSLTTMYENAMETLKQKYESQLMFLRKRLKEQDRLLSMHKVSVNNVIPTKKPRLS